MSNTGEKVLDIRENNHSHGGSIGKENQNSPKWSVIGHNQIWKTARLASLDFPTQGECSILALIFLTHILQVHLL